MTDHQYQQAITSGLVIVCVVVALLICGVTWIGFIALSTKIAHSWGWL